MEKCAISSTCGGIKKYAVAFIAGCLLGCSSGSKNDRTEVVAPRLEGAISALAEEHADAVVYTAQVAAGASNGWAFAVEGEHAALFSMDAQSGELRFVSPPVFNTERSDANFYNAVVVVRDQHGNADRKNITIQVVNDYRLAFVMPGAMANLASGQEGTVPVLIQVYEADGGQPSANTDDYDDAYADAAVSVNGQMLVPHPDAKRVWQGLVSVPAGDSVLSAQAILGEQSLAAEQRLQNRVTFTGAWSLAYDPSRDRVLVPDLTKKRFYAVSAEDGNVETVPVYADFKSYVAADLAYSESLDRFYLSSWGLYAMEGDLGPLTPIQSDFSEIPWGLCFDEQTTSLLFYSGIYNAGVYQLPQGIGDVSGETRIVSGDLAGPGYDLHISLDSERQRLFVANRTSRTLASIDVAAGDKLLLADFSAHFSLLGNVEYDAERNRVYVSGITNDYSSSIMVVNPEDGSHSVLSGLNVLAPNIDGSSAYVGSGPALDHAYALSLDSAGHRLIASNVDGVLEVSLLDGSRNFIVRSASRDDGVIRGGAAFSVSASGEELFVVQSDVGSYFHLDVGSNTKTEVLFPIVADAATYAHAKVDIDRESLTAYLMIDAYWSPRESSDAYTYVFSRLDLQSSEVSGEFRVSNEPRVLDFDYAGDGHALLLQQNADGYQVTTMNLQEMNIAYRVSIVPPQDGSADEVLSSIAVHSRDHYYVLSRSAAPVDTEGRYRFAVSRLEPLTGGRSTYFEFLAPWDETDLQLVFKPDLNTFYILGLRQVVKRFSEETNGVATLELKGLDDVEVVDINRDSSGLFYWLLARDGAVYQYALGHGVLLTQ